MSTALDVKKLSHKYNGGPVLDDVNFRVKKGEFFIVIGPNGSGKSTLLKLIAGIEALKNGQIDLLEKPVSAYKQKELALRLAFVSQMIPGDFPFTVQETIFMGRAPHMGILGIEKTHDLKIAQDAMEFTDISHLAHRRLDQLSGGEQQRVFIARAICQAPQIILLDEPTAFLDLAHQIQVMDLLDRLKTEIGTTIIMVSHDINLAAMYGDRLLLMKQGKVMKSGPPSKVLTFSILEQAYGCVVLVDQSPVGNFPRITPIPQKMNKPFLNEKPPQEDLPPA